MISGSITPKLLHLWNKAQHFTSLWFHNWNIPLGKKKIQLKTQNKDMSVLLFSQQASSKVIIPKHKLWGTSTKQKFGPKRGRPRGSFDCNFAQRAQLSMVQGTSLKDPTKEQPWKRTSRCSGDVRRLRENLRTYPQGQGSYKSLQKRIFLLAFQSLFCLKEKKKEMLRKQCWNMTHGQSMQQLQELQMAQAQLPHSFPH